MEEGWWDGEGIFVGGKGRGCAVERRLGVVFADEVCRLRMIVRVFLVCTFGGFRYC